MPDPYQTLGLSPSAEPADAEVAFRRLLKDAHPDRHVGAADAELADAARRTRELTDAINEIRSGWRPPPGPGSWHEQYGFHASEDADWFGNRIRPTRPGVIDCPLCGVPFGMLADYDLHLFEQHGTDVGSGSPGWPGDGVAGGPRTSSSSRYRRTLRWLRFMPAPSLTLVTLLVLWWVIVVRLAPPVLERVGIWIGVVVFFVLRWLIHHAQRQRL